MGAHASSRRAELAAAVLLLVVAIAGYIAVPQVVSGWAFAMPGTTDSALAPTFFPRLAMVLIGLAAVGVIATAPGRSAAVPLMEMSAAEWRRTATIATLVLLYFGGLLVIGFLLASAAFIIVAALALGYRAYGAIAITAVLAPLLTGLAFRFGMRVILPAGYFGIGF